MKPHRKGDRTRPDDKPPARANAPGIYVCPCCCEKLSGPARFYACPNKRWA